MRTVTRVVGQHTLLGDARALRELRRKDEIAAVSGAFPQCQSGELQSGHPALSRIVQHLDAWAVKPDTVRLCEKRLRVVRRR